MIRSIRLVLSMIVMSTGKLLELEAGVTEFRGPFLGLSRLHANTG